VLRKGVILVTVFLFVSGIASFSFFVSGQESIIPDWVKNNAKWWADGQIAESDFLSAMEYLINEGIIQIQTPIKQVIATDVNLSEGDRAKSIIVHFKGGDYFKKPETYYTYSQFFHLSQTTETFSTSPLLKSPLFSLISLPSIDKKNIYDLVNGFVNPTMVPLPFDVSIDIISGDGTNILTWDYRRCEVFDFSTFIVEDKEVYMISHEDETEIREEIIFKCAGFDLLT